jgi:hypothetical protein
MKVISYTIVHYGADYIGWALRSIYNLVDQAHVYYTPTPSHGHQTDTPPVESREQIQRAAFAYNPDNKIRWFDFQGITQEGQQRDQAVKLCTEAGADLILVVDCDEIWNELTLRLALDYARKENTVRNWLINFTHLWRSFDYCCRDQGWPVRIIDTRHRANEVAYIPQEFGEIYHFGYAVTDDIMTYKWKIHGHKSDMRPGWMADKWAAWPPPPDCHPTNDKDFWMPEPFDKKELPVFMKDHPFYGAEMIR